MSLFSFLRKNKQESASAGSTFKPDAEGEPKPARSRARRKRGSEGNQPIDPVLPEKKRARRRLIGAIALVLAAIIGLPMVLDSEPKPLADNISIQIPSKDKTPPAGNREPARPAASKISASAALDPKEEVIDPPPPVAQANNEPPAAVPATAEKPKETGKPAELAKLEPAKAEPAKKVALTEKPAMQQPTVKIEDKPEARPAAKPDDAARARALLEGKPDPAKTAEKKPGKFVIQVAALATKEKVDELQNKLKEAGIKSYTQKIATGAGDRIRIRVGPFSSKDEADKVRAKIGRLGLNGTLVPA